MGPVYDGPEYTSPGVEMGNGDRTDHGRAPVSRSGEALATGTEGASTSLIGRAGTVVFVGKSTKRIYPRLVPMTPIAIPAPAKINLHLEVLGRRADGFHELETVFQTLELHDRVDVELAHGEDRIELECSDPGLPGGAGNLAWRAAAAVAARVSGLGRVGIRLTKEIPHGAGLGGGSSDAAAVLRALAKLDARVARLDLAAIAVEIGSDVPFFLIGGTAHASGRGEILTAMGDAPAIEVTVLMPAATLATPAIFSALSDAERGPRTALGPLWWSRRLDEVGAPGIAGNRLTAPARRLSPQVAELLDQLATQGVAHLMTGSGAACIAFGAVAVPAGIRAWRTRFRPRARLNTL